MVTDSRHMHDSQRILHTLYTEVLGAEVKCRRARWCSTVGALQGLPSPDDVPPLQVPQPKAGGGAGLFSPEIFSSRARRLPYTACLHSGLHGRLPMSIRAAQPADIAAQNTVIRRTV